jgi:hypothetical protein
VPQTSKTRILAKSFLSKVTDSQTIQVEQSVDYAAQKKCFTIS